MGCQQIKPHNLNRKSIAVFIIGLFLASIVTVTGVLATEYSAVPADSEPQSDFTFTPQAISNAVMVTVVLVAAVVVVGVKTKRVH